MRGRLLAVWVVLATVLGLSGLGVVWRSRSKSLPLEPGRPSMTEAEFESALAESMEGRETPEMDLTVGTPANDSPDADHLVVEYAWLSNRQYYELYKQAEPEVRRHLAVVGHSYFEMGVALQVANAAKALPCMLENGLVGPFISFDGKFKVFIVGEALNASDLERVRSSPIIKPADVCGRGKADANELASSVRQNWYSSKGSRREAVASERKCAQGVADACAEFGLSQEKAGLLAEARSAYEKACAAGSAMGCSFFGTLLKNGLGGPQDLGRARALIKQACDTGFFPSCVNIGLMCMQGLGGPTDLLGAREYFRKGCEDGNSDGEACKNTGILWSCGIGGPKDWATAKMYFERACRLDDSTSCAVIKSGRYDDVNCARL